jgi:nuclear transport factor 2 (NTF2) superfamily protein
MFIVVQQPYGIGDRISIANTETPSEVGGAQGWIVEDVTMFTTTVCLAATSERATMSNGTITKSRIINGARSPNAILYVTMRFAFDTPYMKVKKFRNAVESFVRGRPREWSAMLSFRVALIEANQGYIEYRIAVRHRESWQNIIPIRNSSNTIHAFCLEIAKELDMRYISPALPVDLTLSGNKIPSQFEMTWDKTTGKGTLDLGGNSKDRTHEAGKPSLDSEGFSGVAAMFDADR